MLTAPPTANERARIRKLEAYKVLDTLPEGFYDDIASLASSICDTPIALVSFVDTNRQWFKAKVGLEVAETPRDVAFCSHAIHEEDIFEVRDSRLDDRFHDNPLVTGDPQVVFYAGAPIATPEGHKVGTLCVIDHKPRSLTSNQRSSLSCLSRQIAHILEQRIIAQEHEIVNARLEQAVDELTQFSYRASHDLRAPLVSIRRLSEFVVDDLNAGLHDEAILNVERMGHLAERLEHVVSNVLALHRAGVSDDRTANVELFSLHALVDEVSASLNWLFEDTDCDLKIDIAEDIFTNDQKHRFQQIIQDLISNGVQYRDPEKDNNFVLVKSRKHNNRIQIEVTDNGLGIPEKYHVDVMKMFSRFHPDRSTGSGLGLAIVKKNVETLNGTISFVSTPSIGTTFSVSLPLKDEGGDS